MRIHHLDCGTMRTLPAPAGLDPLPAVAHCLLVETDTDLVLVDTGFGLLDVREPDVLGAEFRGWAQPRLDPDRTAVRQLARLGLDPADVRHVVPTHLHVDHSGGLPDFPYATVHVAAAELASAGEHPHWAHGPRWQPYEEGGEPWFGFATAKQPAGLPDGIRLVPLAGHTPGHTAVAVRDGDGWLLHAGDAYFFHGELRRPAVPGPPELDALQSRAEHDRARRLAYNERLAALVADEPGVTVVCAHDPWEYAGLSGSR
ncbi:MBL fold metallo-hydrolase [Actinocatenispora rupis]|uniref:MBL fold metallo-hydrolase n=1 Tax=Actinocatenispora rupis TaxID=519421 RepID=A0A8J3J5I2_9ACTN|nr:MBL fold metallo-hydrolase [Actinocatenispora rupis]GID10512.1 MBL fold metallo-hydrolase [Actinocatenispora rupis]